MNKLLNKLILFNEIREEKLKINKMYTDEMWD